MLVRHPPKTQFGNLGSAVSKSSKNRDCDRRWVLVNSPALCQYSYWFGIAEPDFVSLRFEKRLKMIFLINKRRRSVRTAFFMLIVIYLFRDTRP